MRGGSSVTEQPWFGGFEFDVGDILAWQLGPLRLWVCRQLGEWRIFSREEGDPLAPVAQVDSAPGEPEGDMKRFIVGEASRRFYVQPLLPDRPLITRPASALYVPGGEAVRFYVSVPLWLRLEEGSERRVLIETPTHRPSDTWFGPSNIVGELCYSVRSRCRLELDETHILPHRAITPVVVRNRRSDALILERIKLPVRQLNLYAQKGGRNFWTEELVLERTDQGDAAKVTPGAPAEAGDVALVAEARDPLQRKTVIRAFSALFQ